MIKLTRRNREPLVVNLAAIQYVEATPDTMVVFLNGERLRELESVDEVVSRALEYQRAVSLHGVLKASDRAEG